MEEGLFIRNLTKKIEGFTLSEVSFSVRPGEILGVIGENGSGKSTLLNALIGLNKADCFDEGIYRNSKLGREDIRLGSKAYKERLAFVRQELMYYPLFVKCEEFADMYGRYYKEFDKKTYVQRLIDYGIDPLKDFAELSTGEGVKAQLALATSYSAKLFIMDEPTGVLDMDFRQEFYDEIRKLVADEEKIVIMATNLAEELEHFADRILWLVNTDGVGKVMFFGTIDELMDNYRLVEAEETLLKEIPADMVVYKKVSGTHSEALIDMRKGALSTIVAPYARMADMSEIMYHVIKKQDGEGV